MAPTISLCIIARDEERMLPGCLASARGVADEIIVADTGSTDATADLARRAGARVVSSPWKDDFAAARNASIAPARGDWILLLDADERLAPGTAQALRRALRHARFDCGMIRLHDARSADAAVADILGGPARRGEPRYLPRLLRRTDDLRFEGLVHENVQAWLVARGMRVAFLDVDIAHLGAAPDLRQALGKSARNVRLLGTLCAQHPDDITAFGYLAHEHLDAGDREGARAAVERGWSLLSSWKPERRLSLLRLATARLRLQLEAGDAAGMLATVDQAEPLEGEHPDFDFLRGSAWELRALATAEPRARARHLERALAAYQAGLGKRGRTYAQAYVEGATTWAGQTRIGTVLLLLGRLPEAIAAFDAALAAQPGHREAELGRAEHDLSAGRPAEALAKLEPILEDAADDRPDGWLLSAGAADALGRIDLLRTFLARARERTAKGYLGAHRRERHAALHLALAAYLGGPMPGPGPMGVLGSLLAREPLHASAASGLPADGALVKRLLANLLRAGKAGLIEPLFEPRAEQAMPGLGAALRAAAADLGVPIADDGEPAYLFFATLGTAEDAFLRALLAAHPALSVIDFPGEGAPETLTDPGSLRARAAALAAGKRRVAFAVPPGALAVDRLTGAFPGASFLLLLRDVRALAGLPGGPGDPLGDDETGDEDRACRWSALVRSARATAGEAKGRYLELRYEDLVAGGAKAARKLFAFLGEREEENVLRHLVEAYPGRADRWRTELADGSRRRVEAAAGQALRDAGYEVAS